MTGDHSPKRAARVLAAAVALLGLPAAAAAQTAPSFDVPDQYRFQMIGGVRGDAGDAKALQFSHVAASGDQGYAVFLQTSTVAVPACSAPIDQQMAKALATARSAPVPTTVASSAVVSLHGHDAVQLNLTVQSQPPSEQVMLLFCFRGHATVAGAGYSPAYKAPALAELEALKTSLTFY